MTDHGVGARQPDILEVISDLSNDEVFTPPAIANAMLDLLPPDVWTNSTLRWLDPGAKTGVYLREVTKRLMSGLAGEIPNEDERLNHILTNMVFGIAITDLTSQISRRSLYCSKDASSEHSVVRMPSAGGNVWFERVEHSYTSGRCSECGATEEKMEKPNRDNHAYAFIHQTGREAVGRSISMKFDVIVGNPPYHMEDGGGEGSSAVPLYNLFVEQAKALNPQYITMVIPARWYSGGKGLDAFRNSMLRDQRITSIDDFPETELIFPGRNIRGGVCYFLWSQGHTGPARITNHRKSGVNPVAVRPLLEPGLSTFVRHNEAISILHKVRSKNEETFSNRVQSRNPYGIPSNFAQFSKKKTPSKSILLYRSRRGESVDREVFIARDQVQNNVGFAKRHKVLVSKASPGGDEFPHTVFSRPFVASPGSVSTETYLIVDFVDSKSEGANLVSYIGTRFFRFLVLLVKNTQNISKGSFSLVPVQDMSRVWTDKQLYKKYNITAAEQEYIEALVKEMPS